MVPNFDRKDLAPRLERGLADLNLIPAAAQEQRALTDKLLDYLGLLVRWNATYNLTAVRDPEQMLTLHLLDSASIAPPLRERLARTGRPDRRPLHVVDVGSGAGLPGVVLAVLWPHAQVQLVEPVGKKAAFLRQVAGELALANVTVAGTRVEALPPQRPPPDVIVCRAFASLSDYVAAVAELAGPDTLVAAMKAGPSRDEIDELPRGWRCRETIALRVPGLDAQRHLVLLTADPSEDRCADPVPVRSHRGETRPADADADADADAGPEHARPSADPRP